ncbi:MAG: tetratricopeptide repeat protein [Limisphaerales bacterium]
MNDFETAKQFFLQGLQLVQVNDLTAAEAMFTRSLEILPQRLSTLNNLAAVKIKMAKFSEAEEFARKAIALDDNSPEAWSNLGLALTATDRHEEALVACDRAVNCDPSHPMSWLAKIVTLQALKRYSDALLACDHALKLDPTQYEIQYKKSLILKELNRPDEAQQVYQQALDLRVAVFPISIGERCATQKAEVLIVNRRPIVNNLFSPFDSLSCFCPNFPGQLGAILHEDFHFNYIFFGNGIQASIRSKISKSDFVLNNHVNGELLLSDGTLWGLTEFVDSFGVPVVNHPAKAVQTSRDVSAKLLGTIPGVIVPKTMRFSLIGKTREAVAREIEDQFDYPLITRTLTNQQGVGMNKIDSREALIRVLSVTGCPENFYITQFVDSRGLGEHYRKIRAAIVGDEIILIRVDFSTHWNVHGRKNPKRWPFYFENLHCLEVEKQICNDPEATLGRRAVEALRATRERIPMDIFGMDFDVDPAGRLIFYEANATMNLFSTAPKELPNPKESGDRLKLAFQRFFAARVAI